MKKIIWALLVIGVLGGIYGYTMYNEPTADVSKKTTEVEIDASTLVNMYKDNEEKANTAYLNKVILVNGTIKEVTNGSGSQNILLETSDPLSSISCEMFTSNSTVKVGDKIFVKGQCTGYLLDVVLTKCVIQK